MPFSVISSAVENVKGAQKVQEGEHLASVTPVWDPTTVYACAFGCTAPGGLSGRRTVPTASGRVTQDPGGGRGLTLDCGQPNPAVSPLPVPAPVPV